MGEELEWVRGPWLYPNARVWLVAGAQCSAPEAQAFIRKASDAYAAAFNMPQGFQVDPWLMCGMVGPRDFDLTAPWPEAVLLPSLRFDAWTARIIHRANAGLLCEGGRDTAAGRYERKIAEGLEQFRVPVFYVAGPCDLRQVTSWHLVAGHLDDPEAKDYEEACFDVDCTRGGKEWTHAPLWRRP